MKLIEYLLNGGTVFDVTYTWPEWLTSDIRTGVENLAMDYALRTIQPRVQLMAEMVDSMDLEDAIHLQVKNRILRNSYKYQTLLATEGFEYNPIENYNMAESTTRTFDKGAQQDSVQYGQDQTSTLHGHTLTRTHADTDTETFNNTDTRTHANSDTQTFADTVTQTTNTTQALTLDTSDARTTSASVSGTSGSTEGARIDNTTESVYGYNSSTASPAKDTGYSKGQQINSGTSSSQSSGSDTLIRTGTETTGKTGTVADAHTGTITDAHAGTIADAHTGTVTNGHTGTITDANSGTDQVTRSQHTDQTTEGARRDAESTQHTRAGNIGVMSTQDLIGQERAVADFSFLGVLTNDLINSFCLGVM